MSLATRLFDQSLVDNVDHTEEVSWALHIGAHTDIFTYTRCLTIHNWTKINERSSPRGFSLLKLSKTKKFQLKIIAQRLCSLVILTDDVG